MSLLAVYDIRMVCFVLIGSLQSLTFKFALLTWNGHVFIQCVSVFVSAIFLDEACSRLFLVLSLFNCFLLCRFLGFSICFFFLNNLWVSGRVSSPQGILCSSSRMCVSIPSSCTSTVWVWFSWSFLGERHNTS